MTRIAQIYGVLNYLDRLRHEFTGERLRFIPDKITGTLFVFSYVPLSLPMQQVPTIWYFPA